MKMTHIKSQAFLVQFFKAKSYKILLLIISLLLVESLHDKISVDVISGFRVTFSADVLEMTSNRSEKIDILLSKRHTDENIK